MSRLRALCFRVAPAAAAAYLSPTDRELGDAGERIAARALQRRGLVLRARRLATRDAEADLVAQDGEVLVVVEVKTARRADPRFPPAARASREALARLEDAARRLARRAGLRHYRVDLVEVIAAARAPPRVRWRRGARSASF